MSHIARVWLFSLVCFVVESHCVTQAFLGLTITLPVITGRHYIPKN